MEKHDATSPSHSFFHLVESFALGMTRLIGARITSLNARLAVLRFRTQPEIDLHGHPYEDVLKEIRSVARRDFEAYEYVTNLSHLTYATSMLDTFLSDCTKLLLLLHPGAIGKRQAVTLDVVLGAKSRSEILNQAAAKKTRELGQLAFQARIEFLKETFGLGITLDHDTTTALV